MDRLNSIKLNILILFFITLLTGCGGGSSSTYTDTSTDTSSNITPKAIHKGQVKDSLTGKGLKNVNVSIGSHTVTTDLEGYYILSDLTETDETVVNFKKEGYLLGSTKIQIKAFSEDNTPATNYLEYIIDSYDFQWSYDSQNSAFNDSIDIPDSIYIDITGEHYTGTVSAELEILDITTHEGKALFPGSFEGIDSNGQITPFITYGLISLSFKDTNGNSLNFTDGTLGTLTFNPIGVSEEQNIIPLWYYNYTQGLWIEEGYAQRQTDGTYLGEISHPGTWSLNKPIESDPGIFRAHIIDEDGSPVSNVRLHAIGDNWISSDLSTDENGLFEIKVIADENFQLSAYNYKDKYGATYDFIIPGIASGDVIED